MPVLLWCVLRDELVLQAQYSYGFFEMTVTVLQVVVCPDPQVRDVSLWMLTPLGWTSCGFSRGCRVEQVCHPLPGKHIQHVEAVAPPVDVAVDVGDVRPPELVWSGRFEPSAPWARIISFLFFRG